MADRDLREWIIDTAVDQYARLGYAGASTREIARSARTQMSSINYHFGSKEALYLACATHVANCASLAFEPAIGRAAPENSADLEEVRTNLLNLLEALAGFMLADETSVLAKFMTGEQHDRSPAFERLHDLVWTPVADRIASSISALRPSLDELSLRLITAQLIGMVISLRTARACIQRFEPPRVCRRLQLLSKWSRYEQDDEQVCT